MTHPAPPTRADDKNAWMASHDLARELTRHRNNDIKVDVNDCLVPVTRAYYDPAADAMVIELYPGEDLKVALSTDALADGLLSAPAVMVAMADHPFVEHKDTGRCGWAKSRDDASTFCWRPAAEHRTPEPEIGDGTH